MKPGGYAAVIPSTGRPTLLRALRSVLAQSTLPDEVVVVLDGVTPPPELASLDESGVPITYLQGLAAGRPAVPRSVGVLAAGRQWVAFLDDDDWWEPTKMARQLAALEGTAAVGSCTNAWVHRSEGVHLFHASIPSHLSLAQLCGSNWVITSSAVCSRDALVDVGCFPADDRFRGVEDYVAWLRLSVRGRWAVIDEPLVNYDDTGPERESATTASADGVTMRDAALLGTAAWLDRMPSGGDRRRVGRALQRSMSPGARGGRGKAG